MRRGSWLCVIVLARGVEVAPPGATSDVTSVVTEGIPTGGAIIPEVEVCGGKVSFPVSMFPSSPDSSFPSFRCDDGFLVVF